MCLNCDSLQLVRHLAKEDEEIEHWCNEKLNLQKGVKKSASEPEECISSVTLEVWLTAAQQQFEMRQILILILSFILI